jgi:ATP-dependent Zn protease
MTLAEKRSATAYHEAGHAVAAIHFGIGIGRKGVGIVPGEDSLGAVHVLKGLNGNPEIGSS